MKSFPGSFFHLLKLFLWVTWRSHSNGGTAAQGATVCCEPTGNSLTGVTITFLALLVALEEGTTARISGRAVCCELGTGHPLASGGHRNLSSLGVRIYLTRRTIVDCDGCLRNHSDTVNVTNHFCGAISVDKRMCTTTPKHMHCQHQESQY